ncbi:hypothetical protein [Thiohalobacter thiocyanaticus]|uniref:Uncharacterized protein n=1 Tax=Thiohalobacter thiocyanaticus TaxID=585455 RepID=A0A426QG36_9GAMM|nr:hypothetical protein [Thiohalobacter thiocyanaticus]RRQ20693.1 hypothetical protein D6C00_00970 [Thiohalobacter thiocyanaticus]
MSTSTTTAKQKYLEALKALRDAETGIRNLESRQSDLRQEQDNAANATERARAALDEATAAGDRAGIDAAFDAVAEANRKQESCAEQISSIDRVIGREREAVASALREAHNQHRLYWLAVEAEEREKCKAAAAPFLRAYRAQVYASVRSAVPLDQYLEGGGSGGGLLGEVGITKFDADSVTFDDKVPTLPPHSQYARVD